MRRGELLVKQIQRATENERVGTQDGISLEEYYQYLTDGVRKFQRAVMAVHATAFRTSTTWSADGAESRALPSDIFGRNRVVSLEYKATSDDKDYYPLQLVTQKERFTMAGNPSQYLLQGENVLVNCYPSAGTFRMVYDALVPAVDKRRATVGSRTLSSTAITALTLSGYTAADYDIADHLTIVDFSGAVKMRGIPYTAVNSGTGVVTIQGSSYTFPEGSTCTVGDYVCLGKNASTHPLIDSQAEDFLLVYAQRRILMRDSSGDAADLTPEENDMIAGILAGYSESPDVEVVPVLSYDYWGDLG
jgi:hypothetical protein